MPTPYEPKRSCPVNVISPLTVNGLAMRYYSNPAFKIGTFTNPDPVVRREAIDVTKRGIDAASEAGSNLMTLWLGQDGFDYAFQADYARLWADEIAGIREVAEHDPDCLISIEYKPNEPRSYSLMPDCATTLRALNRSRPAKPRSHSRLRPCAVRGRTAGLRRGSNRPPQPTSRSAP